MAGRPLNATPLGGCYGPAGWIVCLNGSPPKCMIIIDKSGETAFAIVSGRSRRLGSKQAAVVSRFYLVWLKGQQAAFEIEGAAMVTT